MAKNNEMVCDCDMIHDDLVGKAKKRILDKGTINKIAQFLKAFGDETRAKIINLLEKNELCVCDISVILNMTKSAVSHQLKYLRDMKLIKCRRVSKEVWYSLADEHVSQVFDISLKHVLESGNGKEI